MTNIGRAAVVPTLPPTIVDKEVFGERDYPNMKATIADPISAPIDTVDPIDPTANTADPVVNPMNDSIDPSNHGLSLPTNDLSTDNADIYEPSQMTSAPSLSSSTENIQVGTSDDVSTPLTNPSDQEQLPVVDYPSLTVPSPTYLPEMDDKETEKMIDTDHFADEQEHVYPPDDSSEADYNFDVDIDELDKTTAESAPTLPTASSPQPVLPSLHHFRAQAAN
ncbi:uncharacterized protein B0P05DRAFT_586942 [Gilbertella persicaria]|uniref:uncharacterized protein n=1 Tax=Gilbertella persicaria TaxID=101096 RepID=UPI00222048E8|nr:uncharacterized protein B0P05DRAFT_586942 [Gilbertella persicaria]KAI8080308.1 hypothetical protein B0P05DRAFT_586942 [Gilbertella persicaria]